MPEKQGWHTRIDIGIDMKKKELLKKIEELENKNAELKTRIEYLEAISKPTIIYTPISTPDPILMPPYKFTCTSEQLNELNIWA